MSKNRKKKKKYFFMSVKAYRIFHGEICKSWQKKLIKWFGKDWIIDREAKISKKKFKRMCLACTFNQYLIMCCLMGLNPMKYIHYYTPINHCSYHVNYIVQTYPSIQRMFTRK